MHSRRDFVKTTIGGLALGTAGLSRLADAGIDPRVGGVVLGAQSYSFRELARDASGDAIGPLIRALTTVGIGDIELWAPQVEPAGNPAFGRGAATTPDVQRGRQAERDALRRFRVDTPLSHFADIKKRFDAAGISIHSFNYSFNDSFTDAEIERGFEIARAFGAGVITASTTLSVAKRVVPYAEKHKLAVAMHNHSNITDPNEFATPDSFMAARKLSSYFKVNLDIGHFTAANFDAVAFLKEHHAAVTNLHLKDRKRNQGDNLPWGTGDTPIREVLQLVKKERWPIHAHVEYEYRGTKGAVQEVADCMAFAKKALA
jgi:sugar phosphate isomerase/epimerase